jgi:hypothetical protein
MEVGGHIQAPVAFLPELVWAPEPVWARWRKDSHHWPFREFNPGRPARSLVSVLTEVPQQSKFVFVAYGWLCSVMYALNEMHKTNF